MKPITNEYVDVDLWNLGSGSKETGPFLVVQKGWAPADPTCHESLFLLRRDGLWADLLHYASQGRPELIDEAVFDTPQEVMETLQGLGLEPQLAPAPIDDAGLRAWLAQQKDCDILGRTRLWLEQYRQRRQNPPP